MCVSYYTRNIADLCDLCGTSSVRSVTGSRHSGSASLQRRNRSKRVSRTWWSIPGFYVVRGHTILVCSQFRHEPVRVFVELQSYTGRFRRALLVHARISEIPVQQGPPLGCQNVSNVPKQFIKLKSIFFLNVILFTTLIFESRVILFSQMVARRKFRRNMRVR